MPTACITTPRSRVNLESERLVVRIPAAGDEAKSGGETTREIPLRDLDRMVLGEEVSVSAAALAAMFRRSIPVTYVGWNGQFLGGFLPAMPPHGASRLSQYRRSQETDFVLTMAGRVVAAKVFNQRRLLQRLVAGREAGDDDGPQQPEGDPNGAVGALGILLSRCTRCGNLEELRGVEGAAAARFFEAWGGLLPEAFPFVRRSTRPPLNEVNACLSFASVLLYNEMHGFLHVHGMDPALGMLHTTENGRWSLALDLMEPFRPVLVEALVLDLFSRRMVKADDFVRRDGGVFLEKPGRDKLLLQYEKRMGRQFMSEHTGHRTTLRQQLEHQAVMFKAALDMPDRFEPFLMN